MNAVGLLGGVGQFASVELHIRSVFILAVNQCVAMAIAMVIPNATIWTKCS